MQLLPPAVSLLFAACPLAQAPVLLKDLETGPVPIPYLEPSVPLSLSGSLLFGTELGLHRSVGGVLAPERLKEVPGRVPSIHAMGNLGIFYSAASEFYGEFWRTDGTTAGTFRLLAGLAQADPITVVGNRVFLHSVDGLFVSDGTVAGTRGLGDTARHTLIAVGSRLFFVGHDPAAGEELWVSDGTAAGTVRVRDLQPGPQSSDIFGFADQAGRLVFRHRVNGDLAYWVSDGTAAGTTLLKDIDGPQSVPLGFPGTDYARLGARTVFGAREPTGLGLWQTDGTAQGTVRLAPLASLPLQLIAVGGSVYGTFAGGGGGYELWRTDGTAAGTARVSAFGGRTAPRLFESGGRLFLRADDGVHGSELWTSDGTPAGTVLLADVLPGTRGSEPEAPAPGTLGHYFSATAMTANVEERQLWVTDGTAAGTRRFAVLRLPGRNAGTITRLAAQHGGRAMFGRWPSGAGAIASDATAAGTVDLPASWDPFRAGSADTATLGGRILFTGYATAAVGYELYATDGTAAGTALVRDIDPRPAPSSFGSNPRFLRRLGAKVFCVADDVNGPALWSSDGTPQGTQKAVDLARYQVVEVSECAAAGRWLYYNVTRLVGPGASAAILRTDGTAAGTAVVDGPQANPPWSDASGLIPRSDGSVFFAAWDALAGVELFRSDGTVAGTALVKDVEPGRVGGTRLRWHAMVGGLLFFVGDTTSTGAELWLSDGTPGGTALVKDIRPGAAAADPRWLHAHEGEVYFVADDGVHGYELWRSDGTAGGTVLVRDINPGPADAFYGRGARVLDGQFASVGRWLYFTAHDQLRGTELWRTDGTAAGTTMVADLFPGPLGSEPSSMLLCRGSLLFFADSGQVGRELFALEPGASAQPLGHGCATGTAPRLSATPPRRGSTVRVEVAQAPANGAGVLLAGALAHRPIDLGSGCTVFVDLALPAVAVPFVPTGGRWLLTSSVPAQPSLAGVRVALQAGIGATAQPPLGVDLTPGLLLTIE